MEEVFIFGAKAFLVLLTFAGIAIVLTVIAARSQSKSEWEIEPLHEELRERADFLQAFTMPKNERKAERKKRKAQRKAEAKVESEKKPATKRLFVLDFKGDVQASQVDQLREEITALLLLSKPEDEVLVRVESPGGVVHGYGLAASQLSRLRDRQIPLTVAVDKVAASGGYMMACVANRIIAAPFAIIGSIGVVAQVPNFNRLLKKYDVDYKEYTAGEYKRTVSILGEITPQGEQKFLAQLADTHELFKSFVSQKRPAAQIQEIATGEHWYAERALSLGLVDQIITSDDYLLQAYQAGLPVFNLKMLRKRSLGERISEAVSLTLQNLLGSVRGSF